MEPTTQPAAAGAVTFTLFAAVTLDRDCVTRTMAQSGPVPLGTILRFRKEQGSWEMLEQDEKVKKRWEALLETSRKNKGHGQAVKDAL